MQKKLAAGYSDVLRCFFMSSCHSPFLSICQFKAEQGLERLLGSVPRTSVKRLIMGGGGLERAQWAKSLLSKSKARSSNP